MAETWGIAPWRLEGELSCVWADRWAALQEARAAANDKPQTLGEGVPGNVTRKRLC